MLSPGQIAPPIRHVVRRTDNVRVGARRGDRLRPRPPRGPCPGARRPASPIEIPYDSLIVAAGVDPVVLRPRRVRPLRPGHEDDRRRPGAAPAHLRRLRDGRGGRPTRSSAQTWLTIVIVGAGPTGRRAGRAGPRAGACAACKGEFRNVRPGRGPSAAARRRQGAAGHLRRPALRQGDQGARAPRRRAAHGRPGGRRGRQRRRRRSGDGRRQHRASTPTPRSGPPASRRRRWPAKLAEASGADARPRRPHRGAARPHPARTSRGVRRSATWPTLGKLPGVAEVAMQGGLHAANTICAPAQGQGGVAVQVPRHGQRGDHRPLPRHRQRAQGCASAGSPAGWCGSSSTSPSSPGSAIGCTTMLRWLRSMIGRGRAEREFSTAHTGGDLSLPASVRAIVQPQPVPERRPQRVGTDCGVSRKRGHVR